MSEEKNATSFTDEQQQRKEAVLTAADVLRDGGAALFANTAKAGEASDVIELANYITTGLPYSIQHRHEHLRAFPLRVADLGDHDHDMTFDLIAEAGSMSDLLNRVFGVVPTDGPEEGKSEEDEAEDPFN